MPIWPLTMPLPFWLTITACLKSIVVISSGKQQKVVALTEIQITEKCLRTAGCYDPIKASCGGSHEAFQHKLARLAQAFLPYLGGNGPIEESSSGSAVEEIRTIYLD